MKATLPVLTVLGALFSAQPFAQDSAPANANPPPAAAEARPAAVLSEKDKALRLNFRGVPLDMVLNYMSEAAGFIINVSPGTEIKGKVDVWSNQALTKDEAVHLLNTVLGQNNLASIRTGRTLTIVNRNDAKTRDVPVRKGSKPDDIDKSDEMVTQIMPVHYANAAALIQNLQPLLPEYAQNGLSANESGNSLILTATQTDVRRIAEIVTALDTAIASVSEIKVYPLKYADAKELVAAVKELFTPPAQQNSQGGRAQFLQQMFGGGGPGGGRGGGGPGGGNGGRGGGATGNVSATASRVVAVADERSNSLIVAAAGDAIPEIDRLINEIDVEVDEVTELRVFPLVNADPTETADILAQLFPDPTTSGGQQQQFGRFGGFGGGFGGFGGPGGGRGGAGGAQASASSERAKKQGSVVAVADARTSSLIVTASRQLMPQIEAMIKQLDASRAKRKKVYVYNIENGDPQQIEEAVRAMFDRNNQSGANNNQNSALQNRSQQAAQNQGLNNNTGFGGQGGGGGAGGNILR